MMELLPLDKERTLEIRVYAAFVARAAVDEGLREVQSEALAEMRANCARAVRTAQQIGETDASVDPEREARVMVALVDGLALHAVTDPEGLPPDAAVVALETYLSRLFDVYGERLKRTGKDDPDQADAEQGKPG